MMARIVVMVLEAMKVVKVVPGGWSGGGTMGGTLSAGKIYRSIS